MNCCDKSNNHNILVAIGKYSSFLIQNNKVLKTRSKLHFHWIYWIFQGEEDIKEYITSSSI